MRSIKFGLFSWVAWVSLAWAGSVDNVVSLPNQPTVAALQRDAAGNLYAGGSIPAAHPKSQGDIDAFVAKLSSDGSKVLFWTVLSGSERDTVTALALAPDGSILAIGNTSSSDFPVTPNAVVPHSAGNAGFFARLNTNGNVVYASYIAAGISPSAMVADASGAAYITGAGVLPSTQGTLPSINFFGRGFFLVKLDATGKQVFATGGIGGSVIALDADGFIYVAAGTDPKFPLPVTSGAFQSSPGFAICVSSTGPGVGFGIACSQQYVAKVDPTASKLVYATWLSGTNGSVPFGLSVDNTGDAIVTGFTVSQDYPLTPGSFQTASFASAPPADSTNAITFSPPAYTGYVTKLNPTGTGLVFSTLIGGSGQDSVNSMATDSEGNFYLTGLAASPDFPGLSGTPNGCRPGYLYPVPFLTRLSSDGTALTATQLAFGSSIAPAADLTISSGGSPTVPSVFDGRGKAILAVGGALWTLDLFAPTPPLVCMVDAADQAPLAQVAPGQLVTLFGRELSRSSPVQFQPANGHVPTSLGDGVSVTFDGVAAPILFSSAGQVNVQVPYEIANRSNVRLEIQSSGASVGVRELGVVASQPGAFVSTEYATCHQTVTNSLLPVAHNADGSHNRCENPAASQSTVTFFVNGLGLAGGPLATGVLATSPATPLTLPIAITGDATLVSAQTVPGSVNAVWAVKVTINPELAVSGDWLARFTITIGGVPVRDPLVIWGKAPTPP